MANVQIKLLNGGTTYTFLVEGALTFNERKSQQTAPFPIPSQTDTNAVLTPLLGQVRTIRGTFLLMERTDDYTNGTGSPGSSPYSIDDQKKWLMDTIFAANGRHTIIDELGNQYNGRIQDLEYTKQGDDPLSDSVVFTFTRGLTF